jgi:hypothetical protein
MVCLDPCFYSSNEETVDSTYTPSLMARVYTNMIIADLARRLQERVELELSRTAADHPHEPPRRIAPEVEIEGMDVLLQALSRSTDEIGSYGDCSSTCSDSLDSSLCGSDIDDDSVLQMRRGKRRCQFRNRRNIGRHVELTNELNVDSLRLARKTMEDKKTNDNQDRDSLDYVSFESTDLLDEVSDTIVMLKDASRSSLSSLSSAQGVASHAAPLMRRVRYGNAAA